MSEEPSQFVDLVRHYGTDDFVDAHAELTNATVARWRHSLVEVADLAFTQDTLCLVREPIDCHRLRGSRREPTARRPGDFGIMPKGSYGAWRFASGKPVELLHIYYPTRCLELFTADCGARPNLELQDRLAFADVRLRELAGALDDALDKGPVGRLYMDGLTAAIAVHLLSHYGALAWVARQPSGLAPWQLLRAREYIETNYARDLGLEEIAKVARLSPYHFARAFRQSTGAPPHRYLVAVRIARAKELLETTSLPISEVALRIGYQDQGYFARLFLREVGLTPTGYRRARFL